MTEKKQTLDILYSIGCDIVDGAVVPGQGRVVVASDAGCGELIQDILSLMEGHQTHTKQREAAKNRDTNIIGRSERQKTTYCCD